MVKGRLAQIHPVLPVRNIIEALHFYVEKLGFEIAFADDQTHPSYAGVRRDNIEIHLQYHSSKEWESITASSLRFVVENIDALFAEYLEMEVYHKQTSLKETSWGTQEFAFYDPDSNGLTFYRDL